MRRLWGILALASVVACSSSLETNGHRLGAVGPPTFPIVYTDPSTGAGRAGAVGDIVQLSGGTAAWQKTDTSSTGWSPVTAGGGGGGGTGTVNVAAPITGTGAVSTPITVSPASASAAGSQSAANFTREKYMGDQDGWFSRESLAAFTAVPGLTRCREVDLTATSPSTQLTLANAFTEDAQVNGGAAMTWSSVGSRAFTQGTVWKLPKTGPWAVGWQGIVASGASYAGVGWSNSNNSHDVIIGAVSSTTYKVARDGSAVADTGVSIDANPHDFLETSDDLTAEFFVDDVVRTTFASSTFTDANVTSYGYSTADGAVKVMRLMICY